MAKAGGFNEASQIYELMHHVSPAGLNQSSMLNSIPATVPSSPNVSSYATDSGTLRPCLFLPDHAVVVNPLGAPLRSLLVRTLVQQANDRIQASAEVSRLRQLQQRAEADISAAQSSLRLLQAQHERVATRVSFLQIQDSSSACLASQNYQLMPHAFLAGMNRSSMLNSNPVTIPSSPNLSSCATAQPAVQATNQLGSYTKPLDSIPMDALYRVSSKSRATSAVTNSDTSKVTSSQPHTKKRGREVSNGDSDSEVDSNTNSGDVSKHEVRFNSYQERQWGKKFDELRHYRDCTGNCCVPESYEPNQPLAKWVKRQRYQYKLMRDGKPSVMTEERAKALKEIGFVWCSQDSTWTERLGELKKFRGIFNHCNVPTDYSENPSLAYWIKRQRHNYKLYEEGKFSNMKIQRIRDLEDIGFEWAVRVKRSSSS
jgi:hypothetical protein